MKKLLAILGLLFPVIAATAPPKLDNVLVREPASRSPSRGLDTFIPAQRHVLFVVDPRHAQAQAMLHALAREGLDGERTTVLVLASEETPAIARTIPAEWHAAQVLVGEPERTRDGLATRSPVTAFGIAADGRIAWRHGGTPKSLAELMAQILDWVE